MTDKEELTRGDALAKVAALEAENAELRKRVCVLDEWTREKPTVPGAYWVRGNGLPDALVVVKYDEGELWCNLHMSTTEQNFGYGFTIEQLDDRFEWLGPLAAAPAPVEGVPPPQGTQAISDAITTGRGFVSAGKRVPPEDVYDLPVERVEREAQSKVARCIGMRPGMGEVTVKVEDGIVSGWLDPGCAVYIYPTPQPAAPAAPVEWVEREAQQSEPVAIWDDMTKLARATSNRRIKHGAPLYATPQPSPSSAATAVVGWINEDELPENYPYDAMFPFSKVDIVRMFPVYAPAPDVAGLVEALEWCEKWFSRHSPTAALISGEHATHPMLSSIRAAIAAHQQREG